MFCAVFDTAAGWVGIAGSVKGLCLATLPQRTERAVYTLMADDLKNAVPAPQRFDDLIERYRAYFSGKQVEFLDGLDLEGATPFQRSVWQVTRNIPYGQTRDYAWVAEQAGYLGAARAAGQALARNPLPVIIPCHRVLASDGGLGGFSGGLAMKRFLLKLEAGLTKD
jgi:methylated-DNA-[protein]-cysteine S-methyltransferase